MNDIIWITVMSIILGGVIVKAYFLGCNKGFEKAEYVNGLVERGIEAISGYIQSLKDRGCDVNCSGRIPLDERTDNKLLKIGYNYYLKKEKKRHDKKLDAEIKELQGSPCLKCHDRPTCQDRDDKLEECPKFWDHARPEDEQDDTEAMEEVEEVYLCLTCHYEDICATQLVPKIKLTHYCAEYLYNPGKDDSPINSDTGKSVVQQITEANKEAAESVKDIEIELNESLTVLIGATNIEILCNLGFSREESLEIKWSLFENCIIGAHPKHKPVIVKGETVRFMAHGEEWPESV